MAVNGVGLVDEEIGRVKKNDTVDVVVRRTEFKGSVGIDIREYMSTERYTGWSKNGIRIPMELWIALKEVLDRVEVGKGEGL
jgi:hypothetical protein